MKANDEIILKVISSTYLYNNSLNETIENLLKFNLIDSKQYNKLLTIIKEQASLNAVLEYLVKNKKLIEYISFFNNHYPLNISIDNAMKIIKDISDLKKDILSSLIYPSILIILTSIAMLFVSNFIIPQLLILSPNSQNKYTLLLFIIKFIPLFLTIIILSIVASISSLIYLLKKDVSKYLNIVIKIPIIQFIIKQYNSLIFCLYLKEIIRHAPLTYESFLLLQQQSSDLMVKYLCSKFIISLQKGIHLFDVVNNTEFLSSDLKQTIIISLNSKQLAQLLDNFYNLKTTILKRKIKALLALVIPIIVGSIGILIIIMYLLIMLPILDLSSTM